MRIAYVINSLEGGGAALPLPKVLDLLRGEGHEVALFALARRDGRATGPVQAAGFEPHTPTGAAPGRLRSALWLAAGLRAFHPDLVWTSLTQATVTGQLVGALFRVPVVSWQHNAFLKPANLRLLRLTRRLTALWVADSAAVAELTADRLSLAPEQVAVWPLFVADPRPLPPCPLTPRPPGERLRIGSLGRLHRNKGYDVLVDSLARLRRRRPDLAGAFEIAVAGEGAEREALAAAAARAGMQEFHLVGFQGSSVDFLAGCHAYVQPSRAEGLCIAAHEALQAGLPCIVTDVGEMARSVLAAGAGWVVPAEDADRLAEALAALVDDPEGAAAIGARGRAWVLQHYAAGRFAVAGRAVLARIATRGPA